VTTKNYYGINNMSLTCANF